MLRRAPRTRGNGVIVVLLVLVLLLVLRIASQTKPVA
jgi:hypothetical protein